MSPGPDVSARLRQLVAEDGRSARQVAAAAGLDPKSLERILAGPEAPRRTQPTVPTLARLLAALGKSWKDLEPP